MFRSRWIGLGIVLSVALILGACGNQWLAGGKLHFDQKRYDKALIVFQKAVEEKPTSGEAHLWLGRAMAELDRDAQAIAELKKAKELDPLQEEMVHNSFVSYWSRRYNSALTFAKNGEDEQRKGDTGRAQEELGKAEERFRRAALFCPDSVQNYSNLGKILYRLGRRDEGLEMFHKAKEMSTNRPDLQQFLFHLFRELGLSALENPTKENLQRGLGLLLDASGLPGAAEPEQLAEIDLNIAEAYRGLADSVSEAQKPEMQQKSAEYYDRVLQSFPDDVDALEGLAQIQARLGQTDAAMVTAQKRLDLEPWDRSAHLTVYRILSAARGENDRDAKGHGLFLNILSEGKPQAREGMRAWAVKEFGPTSDMIRALRDRGDPETMREYTPAGQATIYMWAYWTGGRAYIFQGGKEVYRLTFKAVPRENVPEDLLQ